MQKSYLFDLISLVDNVLDESELPIIVGSQALFAQTDHPPLIVRESRECDFLLFGGRAAERDKINREYGVFSPFADEKGYYADALGLASVVLPDGWQDRLQPFLDPSGRAVARCLEIYDLAASKIAAGRPKDLEFLAYCFSSDLILVDPFLERSLLLRSKLENDALGDRFHRLIKHLYGDDRGSGTAEKIKAFISENI